MTFFPIKYALQDFTKLIRHNFGGAFGVHSEVDNV